MQRRVALIGPGVEPHDLAVRLLAQRIQRQPAPGRHQGRGEIARGALADCQPLQRIGQLPAQRLGLGELPVIELGTVPQGEASQEIAAVERRGLGQGCQARGANLGRGMAVRPPGSQPRVELGHVHP